MVAVAAAMQWMAEKSTQGRPGVYGYYYLTPTSYGISRFASPFSSPLPYTQPSVSGLMLYGGTIPEEQRGEPWFNDGNIVVFTDGADSDTTVAFKVHRGVLARHSEIFQSMFELPPPMAEVVEMIDGCQVVRMHDRPVELSALIRALYDGP